MRQMLLSFPKNRGFQSLNAKAVTIPVERLEVFRDGTKVDMQTLREAGLVKRQDGRVKIVAGGELTKKLVITQLACTPGAQAQIEKAGGSVAKKAEKKAKASRQK
jgi:large subunit ribosomal protein L15